MLDAKCWLAARRCSMGADAMMESRSLKSTSASTCSTYSASETGWHAFAANLSGMGLRLHPASERGASHVADLGVIVVARIVHELVDAGEALAGHDLDRAPS